MPRTIISRLIGLLLFGIFIAPAAVAQDNTQTSPPTGLVAFSGADHYYLGLTSSVPDAQPPARYTRLFTRQSGAGETWKPLALISAPVKSLTRRGEQLAALLDDGTWLIVWQSAQTQGARVGAGKLLAIAGDDKSFWGVASVPGGIEALTKLARSSEATTGPSSHPATRPEAGPSTANAPLSPARLVLVRLDRSDWIPVSQLPETMQPSDPASLPPRVSMTLAAHAAVVAVQDGEASVHLARFNAQNQWVDEHPINSGEPIAQFSLVSGASSALLFLSGTQGTGSVAKVDADPPVIVPLVTTTSIKPNAVRTVTIAGERLRLLFTDGAAVQEQKFDLLGQPIGQTAVLQLPMPVIQSPLVNYLGTLVMLALMFSILSALRQRPAMAETIARAGKLPLAGLGVRFAAGLIDALPLLITVAVIVARSGIEALNQLDTARFVPILLAGAAYVGHVTLLELLTGRSIGKMLFRLRVTTLTGSRPTIRAILLRNVIRVADLWLMGAPLILMLYSPLKQRIGDIAAGTIVLNDRKVPTEKPSELP